MAESTEDIEGRLAAYIDGELAGSEREEIERHLAANPSHRTLVSELIQQRNAIVSLPREKAPADLLEELQGQLERETLLGGEESLAAQTPLRIRHWPQIISIAAMLLLAIGIAALVYSMFPKGKPQVVLGPSPKNPVVEKEKVAQLKAPASPQHPAPSDLLAEKLRDTQERSGVADASLAKGETEALMKKPRGGPAPQDLFALNATAGTFTPTDSNGTVYITVTANDLGSANSAVVSFLDENKIDWSKPQAQPASFPDSVGTQAFAFGALEQEQEAQRIAEPPAISRGRGLEPLPPAPVQPPDAAREDNIVAPIAAGVDDPAKPLALGEQAFGRPRAAEAAKAPVAGEAPVARVILVRNINRRQLEQLTRTLGAAEKGQVAVKRQEQAQNWAFGLEAEPRQYYSDYFASKSIADGSQRAMRGMSVEPALSAIDAKQLAGDLPLRADAQDVVESELAHAADPVQEQPARAKQIELDSSGIATNADVRYAAVIVLQPAPAAPAATTRPATTEPAPAR